MRDLLLDLLEMAVLLFLGLLALAYGWVALWLTVCAIDAWVNRPKR